MPFSGLKSARIRRGFCSLLLGQTEIQNLELLTVAATPDNEKVGRLNIAMDDATGVGGGERAPRLLG